NLASARPEGTRDRLDPHPAGLALGKRVRCATASMTGAALMARRHDDFGDRSLRGHYPTGSKGQRRGDGRAARWAARERGARRALSQPAFPPAPLVFRYRLMLPRRAFLPGAPPGTPATVPGPTC